LREWGGVLALRLAFQEAIHFGFQAVEGAQLDHGNVRLAAALHIGPQARGGQAQGQGILLGVRLGLKGQP
jgi:hypothetical protein